MRAGREDLEKKKKRAGATRRLRLCLSVLPTRPRRRLLVRSAASNARATSPAFFFPARSIFFVPPAVDKTKWLEEFVTKVAREKGWTVTATAADLIFTKAAELATKGFKWIGHILDDGETRLTVAMVQKALKADEEEDYEVGPECSRDDFGVEPAEPAFNNESQDWGGLELDDGDAADAEGGAVGAYLGADDSEDSGDEEYGEQKMKAAAVLKLVANLSVEVERLEGEQAGEAVKTWYKEKLAEGRTLETKEKRNAAFATLKNIKTLMESAEYKDMFPEQHEKYAELHQVMAREKRLPQIIAEKRAELERVEDLYEARKEQEERAKTDKRLERLKREAARADPVSSSSGSSSAKKRAKVRKAVEILAARRAK